MNKKLKVGILGATGMVGQRFISLLEDHPWFEVVTVAAREQGYIIGGRYLISGTAEFQHPIPFYSGNDIRQNWFVDAGMAPNNVHTERVSVGVGTGVRYITKIGIIKADLAFGVSEVHIPLKVHIGIGVDL